MAKRDARRQRSENSPPKLERSIERLKARRDALLREVEGLMKSRSSMEAAVAALRGEEEAVRQQLIDMGPLKKKYAEGYRLAERQLKALEGKLEERATSIVLLHEPENLRIWSARMAVSRLQIWARGYRFSDIGRRQVAEKYLGKVKSVLDEEFAQGDVGLLFPGPDRLIAASSEPKNWESSPVPVDFRSLSEKVFLDRQGSMTLEMATEYPALVRANSELRHKLESCELNVKEMQAYRFYLKERDEKLAQAEAKISELTEATNRQSSELVSLETSLAKKQEEVLQSEESRRFIEERAEAKHKTWQESQMPLEVKSEALSLLTLTAQAIRQGQPRPDAVPAQVYDVIKEQIEREAEEKKGRDYWVDVEERALEIAETKYREKMKSQSEWLIDKVLPWLGGLSQEIRAYSVDLLRGEYTLTCDRCNTPFKVALDERQIALLQGGDRVLVQCGNPKCTEDSPAGLVRHSMPLSYGGILKMKLLSSVPPPM